MTKSNGIKSLKQAAKLLNKHAPDGESLAYINPEEGRILKSHGASGIMTVAGVPSYAWYDFLKPVGEAITKYAPKVLDYGQKALDLFNIGTPAKADEPHPGSSMGTEYGDEYWQTGGYFPNQPVSKGPMGDEMWDKSKNPFWKDVGSSIMQSGKDFLKGRYGGADAIKNIGKDALSVWTALKAKKDQEGLNNAEMEQFNKLNQQLAAAQAEFTSNIEGGGVTNMPTDITDVASYTDVTLPAMKTTAVAEGGRIGFKEGTNFQTWLKNNNHPPVHDLSWDQYSALSQLFRSEHAPGEAQGGRIGYDEGTHPLDNIALQMFGDTFENLNPLQQITVSQSQSKAQGGRIGYNLGGIDRPFQGIGALNPRMGYQVGSSDIPGIPGVGKDMRDQNWETKNWEREEPFLPLDTTKSTEVLDFENVGPYAIDMKQEDVSTTGGNKIQETVIALINSHIVGDTREALEHAYILNEYEINSPGVTDLALSLINSRIVGDVREAIEQALIIMKASQTQGNAHGGRIGAQGGGIMPLLNMGGMEKDYRQDGGFVPIGRKEKADDVPARLSKNEFVFTADAVRAAGGGDIDQGAQRMYNVMKNLEAGGEISKQSQGQG